MCAQACGPALVHSCFARLLRHAHSSVAEFTTLATAASTSRLSITDSGEDGAVGVGAEAGGGGGGGGGGGAWGGSHMLLLLLRSMLRSLSLSSPPPAQCDSAASDMCCTWAICALTLAAHELSRLPHWWQVPALDGCKAAAANADSIGCDAWLTLEGNGRWFGAGSEWNSCCDARISAPSNCRQAGSAVSFCEVISRLIFGFQKRFRLFVNQFVSCFIWMPVASMICCFSTSVGYGF